MRHVGAKFALSTEPVIESIEASINRVDCRQDLLGDAGLRQSDPGISGIDPDLLTVSA